MQIINIDESIFPYLEKWTEISDEQVQIVKNYFHRYNIFPELLKVLHHSNNVIVVDYFGDKLILVNRDNKMAFIDKMSEEEILKVEFFYFNYEQDIIEKLYTSIELL